MKKIVDATKRWLSMVGIGLLLILQGAILLMNRDRSKPEQRERFRKALAKWREKYGNSPKPVTTTTN